MKEITFEVRISGYDLEDMDLSAVIYEGFNFFDNIQWRNIRSTEIMSEEVEDIDPPYEW